jgi:hypothetical protein
MQNLPNQIQGFELIQENDLICWNSKDVKIYATPSSDVWENFVVLEIECTDENGQTYASCGNGFQLFKRNVDEQKDEYIRVITDVINSYYRKDFWGQYYNKLDAFINDTLK